VPACSRSLNDVERRQSELIATVAHELRSPLTSVKGFTATLLAKWERFDDEQKKAMLATVNADADRVTRLIADLLDASRIDTGRLELRRQVVDLAAIVDKVVAGEVAAGFSADRFVVEAGSPLPETWADPDKVEQVFANLVENALVHGEGTVTVGLTPDRLGTAIRVRDQGEGIEPEERERIFGRFFRSYRRSGTGLGLYIAKGIVEAHGGSIAVGDAPAGGAELRLTLPPGAPPYDA
jgi:signal transduction histidine kinase